MKPVVSGPTFFVDEAVPWAFGSGAVRKVRIMPTPWPPAWATFLSKQGDAIGLTTFHEHIAEQFRRVPARTLASLHGDAASRLPRCGHRAGEMLRRVPILCRKRGLVVIVSDFLVPAEEIAGELGSLRAAGHDVVLFRVLDPVEVSFDFDRAGHFHDAESGREVFVDPAKAKQRYLERFAAHEKRCSAQPGRTGLIGSISPRISRWRKRSGVF